MKKVLKKALALVLCLSMIFSLSVLSFAYDMNDTPELKSYSKSEKFLWNTIDVAFTGLLKGIAFFGLPLRSWVNKDLYSDGFLSGTGEFKNEAEKDAAWFLGYDSRSILLPKEDIIGKMYVGGGLVFDDKFAEEIYDDLKVRTAALSDGSETAVISVIDGYGLALSDVREIRMRLEDFAKEKGITSITLSVLHQHSAVDTFGMNGNILKMAFTNPAKNLFGKKTKNGKNEKYMENLFEKCTESIISAVNSKTEGKLFEGKADASSFLRDKRQPYVMDKNFTRLRFVPLNGSKETWIVTSAIHCVGNGAQGRIVTGDYPYYVEKEISQKANMLMVLGAEQGSSQVKSEATVEGYKEDMTSLEMVGGFGKKIAGVLKNIDEEKEIAPILNVRYKEIYLPVENPILLFGGKCGLLDNIIKFKDCRWQVKTEIGYMELGKELAFAVIPGELAAEIAYGGTLSKEYSWSGKDFEYPTLSEVVFESRGERELLVLGLSNDQIGYIIPDNDYMPTLFSDSNSLELVSLGKHTASTLIKNYESLMNDIG